MGERAKKLNDDIVVLRDRVAKLEAEIADLKADDAAKAQIRRVA